MIAWIKQGMRSIVGPIDMSAPKARLSSDDIFSKLAYQLNQRILHANKHRPFSPSLLFEKGKIAGETPYFYIQPWNELGYLFERGTKGWSICKAEKIAHEGRFLRSLESIDIATVDMKPSSSFVRIYSAGFGEELLPFLIYEETIWNQLFKHFIEVQNNV